MVSSASGTLRPLRASTTVPILTKAFSAKGVIAVEHDWVDQWHMAYWAHQIRVVLGNIFKIAKLDRSFRVDGKIFAASNKPRRPRRCTLGQEVIMASSGEFSPKCIEGRGAVSLICAELGRIK